MFFENDVKNPTKREAVALFNEAYELQMSGDYDEALQKINRNVSDRRSLHFLRLDLQFSGRIRSGDYRMSGGDFG
jgi:hypothetical protein